MSSGINASTCPFCFIDLDIDDQRSKLATCAAFVDATDSRYGFSSKDLRQLGGSELARIPDLIKTDHEWSAKVLNNDVVIRAPASGNRIVVKLYWNVAPLACENFATLCANGSILPGQKKVKPAPVGDSGKPLTYRGSNVHRIIPDFVLQGGDFVKGNGSGGESIFNGKKFKDERAGLQLKHDRQGVLSMGNSGKNSNSSQFFLALAAAPQCDGKHVVFGEVVSGHALLDYAATVGSQGGEPTVAVTITDCGIYVPLETPAAGYWYDKPDPDNSFCGYSSAFMVIPRFAVVAPTQVVADRFIKALGGHALVTPVVANSEETDDALKTRVGRLLSNFNVDVVLVAPACSKAGLTNLPLNWKSDMDIETVVMQTKPANALVDVRTKSWLAQQSNWQLHDAI